MTVSSSVAIREGRSSRPRRFCGKRNVCLANGLKRWRWDQANALRGPARFEILGLSGIALLRVLRLRPETKTLPVFIINSTTDPRSIAECESLGVSGFVPKRFPIRNSA